MTRLLRFVALVSCASVLMASAVVGLVWTGNGFLHGTASAQAAPLASLETLPEQGSTVYAADGSVIATLQSSQNRQPVPLSGIAPILQTAVLDTEDQAFWVHGGFDLRSTARALIADTSAGAAAQGGSTIDQQLVKNTYLTPQKTVSRKLKEVVLAERLLQHYSKSQILDAYLNTVYLGNGAYGVEAAAEEYFGVHASQVNLAQSALLAGLIQSPSGYDPIHNPVGARHRRSEVLGRMVFYKSITQAQSDAANATALPTSVNKPNFITNSQYGYYVEQIEQQLLDGSTSPLGSTYDQRYQALFEGGLKIYTNLVPSLQNQADKVERTDVPKNNEGFTAAFAVINPQTGGVEALVGGPGTSTQQFDLDTQGKRQPGSGFKLFTLLAAIQQGYNVNDVIDATSPCAVRFPGVPDQFGYSVANPMHNDPGDPNGPITLVEATALSVNCAYLRLGHEVGLSKIVDMAKNLGIGSEPGDPVLNPTRPSLIIGTEIVKPIEMAAAYATVADGGIYHAPTFIKQILDRTGTNIYNGSSPGKRVIPEQVAAQAIVALKATVAYGTGVGAAIPGQEVAGKTGTTTGSVDAWFNGITPELAASVWMGDPKAETPMYLNGVEVYGADYPTQVWHDVISYGVASTAVRSFPTVNPALEPPVKYVDSLALENDDLTDHGGAAPGGMCITNGQPLVSLSCLQSPTTLPTTAPAPTTTSSTSVPGGSTTSTSTSQPGSTTSLGSGGGNNTTTTAPPSPTVTAAPPTTSGLTSPLLPPTPPGHGRHK